MFEQVNRLKVLLFFNFSILELTETLKENTQFLTIRDN